MQVDDFKPEAGDPQYEPGQGGLIGQLGTKGRRGRAYGDRAVIEFRVQRGTRLPGESDLICLGSHQGYALQAASSFAASVLGGGADVTTLWRVIRKPAAWPAIAPA